MHKGHVLFITLLLSFVNICFAQNTFRVYGKVTDFNSNPIEGAKVSLKDKSFNDLYQTITIKDGSYSIEVPERTYYCLYAIRPDEYGKTKLEYWTWNVPVYNDLEINPQYDRLEIYGMNAFEPQVSPYETYIIYFRTMSLTKSKELMKDKDIKKVEREAIKQQDTLNISPKITPNELEIKIDGEKAQVLTLNRVVEYARGAYMYGYIVQILKPKEKKNGFDQYDKVTLVLHSKETGEYGKGELYITKKEY